MVQIHICKHVFVPYSCIHTQGHIRVYTLTCSYILYMQVFDGCHAVTKLVFADVSVYMYMYLQLSTVHLFTHM